MNLSVWIERRADFAPNATAIRFEGIDVTYRALAERIGRQAAMLSDELGIRHGDRVAYLGLNSPEMLALLFACARVGAVFVPMNWRLAPPEHRTTLVDCAPAVIFAEPEFVAHVAGIREDLRAVRLVRMGSSGVGWLAYDELLTAAPVDQRQYGADYADPVLLCYTSGSTGKPKGAVLTQSALLWNAINSTHMHDLTSADRILTTLPLFHVGGLNIQTLPALHAGATVLLHRKFDVGATFAAIAEDRPTLAVLVPTQIAALVDDARWASADLSSLRLISTGSTIVPERLIHAVHARGVPLIQVYGSTETAPIAVYLAAADAIRKAGSAGKPAIHCEMRLVDALGSDVAPGRSGEILVRGRNLMCGYWNNSELTAQALLDGWFHSGDIGHLDDEGFLFIDGRITEMIISGGENIYPAPLEAILAECPGVREAAIVGRPDERWGEAVVAVVVREPGSTIEASDVLARFAGRIARYKHPRDVVFVDQLPRNALGKVTKDALRRLVRTAGGDVARASASRSS